MEASGVKRKGKHEPPMPGKLCCFEPQNSAEFQNKHRDVSDGQGYSTENMEHTKL